MLRMSVTMNNVWHFLLLLLTTICCHGVGADRFPPCFRHYENGTIDDQVYKECTVEYHCCGVDNLKCCRDSQFDNPYWMSRLAFKIVLLVLAIGSAIKYLSRKYNCCNNEPEHLVFVNQMVDANGAPIAYPAAAPNYQPYPPIATGQFQPNTTTNMPTILATNTPTNNGAQGHMGPYAPQQALSSFNPYNSLYNQGYDAPPENQNNPHKLPQNPSKPPTPVNAPNISTVSDSNSPLNRHAANFI